MSFLKYLKSLPWARIGLSFLCVVLAVVLVAGVGLTVFIESNLNKISRPGDPNLGYGDITLGPDETLPPEGTGSVTPPDIIITAPTEPGEPVVDISHKDIVNIMLVGIDRRPGEKYNTRSDSMILCTVNTRNNSLTMTSFLRDIYVSIPGRGGNKLNAAYQYGGMKLLGETMKLNFGIAVDKFITVDFSSFSKIVDIVGGVSIELRQDEAAHLNKTYGYSLSAGMQRLNGAQALNYARIRYIGYDFERTLRQRKVITSIMNSCKNLSGAQLMALVNEFLPLVQTNMDNATIMRYALDFLPVLTTGTMTSQRIPLDGTWKNATVGNVTDTLWCDMEANQQFLFNTLMPR